MSKNKSLTTFDEIVEKVLEYEGGYINDPDDPGKETKYGISKKHNPKIDIRNLTVDQAKEIYHKKYWIPNKCDSLPSHLRHLYFDSCVNQGAAKATKVLQKAINNKSTSIVKVDGKIGPKTIAASQDLELDRAKAYRIKSYVHVISFNPRLEKYFYGWFRRVIEI